MKFKLLLCLIGLQSVFALAQTLTREISTNYYFGDLDTQFFAPQHILANKIKVAREYRSDKKYADTALLMAEYFFTDAGYLSKAISYDIQGKSSISEYKQNADNKITEVLYSLRGEMTPIEQHEYKDGKLIKKTNPYRDDHNSVVEYGYNEKGQLISQKNIFNKKPTGERTAYHYTAKGQLEKEEQFYHFDTIRYCYNYTYNEKGKLTLKEIDYGYTKNTYKYAHYDNKNKIVEKTYYNNKLVLIQTEQYNKQGKLISSITDRRMVKKSRRGKNDFCGYNGPPRYRKITYKYDAKGNCTMKKDYFNILFCSGKTKHRFDANNKLIQLTEYEGLKKDDEFIYTYNK
jgi:hypothetical protein